MIVRITIKNGIYPYIFQASATKETNPVRLNSSYEFLIYLHMGKIFSINYLVLTN